MNNKPQTTLSSAIKDYFGAVADMREPIKTDMVDQKVVGSVSNRNVLIPSEVSLKLKANKSNRHILHVIHKVGNGMLTLNTVFPFQQVTHNINGSGLNTVNVGVITPASSSKHERSTGPNVDLKSIAFGNSNFGAFARTFSSDLLNGCSISGNLTETYVPKLKETWIQPYHGKVPGFGDKIPSVGVAINHITLLLWKMLKSIESDTKLKEAQREEKIQQFWNEYQVVFNDWIARGYLDTSIAVYAEPNSVDPDVSAYLGITAAADELNPAKIYSEEGETSFIPEVNKGYLTAIILDEETDDEGKFQFGIFKASSTRDNLVTLTEEDEIANTPEVCTRRVLIQDGAGNPVKIQVRVRDEVYGSNRPIKLARSFWNIPVGSPVEIRGKLQFRMVKSGSQAITAEVVATRFKTYSAQNMIIGDISTADADELLSTAEAGDSFFSILGDTETLESQTNEALAASTVDETIQPSETLSDDNM